MGQKPSRQYPALSTIILNDEEGTIILGNGKDRKKNQSMVELSDGTILGVENVCRLYADRCRARNSRMVESGEGNDNNNEHEAIPLIVEPPPQLKTSSEDTKSLGIANKVVPGLKRRKSKLNGLKASKKGKDRERDKDRDRGAQAFEDKTDEEKCLELIENIFMLLLKTRKRRRELVNLPFEALERLMQSDNLMISDEYALFLLVGAWADNIVEAKQMEMQVEKSRRDAESQGIVIPDTLPIIAETSSSPPAQSALAEASLATDRSPGGERERREKEERERRERGESGNSKKRKKSKKRGDRDRDRERDSERAADTEGREASSPTDDNGSLSIELASSAENDYNTIEALIGEDEEGRRRGDTFNDLATVTQSQSQEDLMLWSCVACTYLNARDALRCEVCNTDRPADEGDRISSIELEMMSETDDREWEWDEQVPLPKEKETPEYLEMLKAEMAPLLQYIRFPLIQTSLLVQIEDSGLVPKEMIKDAYKQIFMHKHREELVGIEVDRPLIKPRRYATTTTIWDNEWHGSHIKISADGKKVHKEQPGWYALAFGKKGYSTGVHHWAIKVNGKEVHIGLARRDIKEKQQDNYLGADTYSWSYNMRAIKANGGEGCRGGGIPYGELFGEGDIIGVKLDMYRREVTFFKNGKNLGVAFTGLPEMKLYPAVGWRQGYLTFVSLDPTLEM